MRATASSQARLVRESPRERKRPDEHDHRLRRSFALLAALILAIGVAACGDDDSTTSDETDSAARPAAP